MGFLKARKRSPQRCGEDIPRLSREVEAHAVWVEERKKIVPRWGVEDGGD